MKMNTKIVSLLMLVMLLSTGLAAAVSNTPVDLEVTELLIDGKTRDLYDIDNPLEVERGEELEIELQLNALTDVKDVTVTAMITGYEYGKYEFDKIFDSANVDVDAGNDDWVDLNLEIPMKLDETYAKLRIVVSNMDDLERVYNYELAVVGVEDGNEIIIKDAYLSPANEVMAGRALTAQVTIENVGRDDFEDVTLIASVPGLNIRDTETLDLIEVEEKETFEEVILRFPKDAAPGDYLVEYKIKYDEYETVIKNDLVSVLECTDVACGAAPQEDEEAKTYVTVADKQVVGAAGAVFPIMITNTANNAKSYMVDVVGVDAWGTARVDPSATVIVPAQDSTTVFLYVSGNEDVQAGEKFFQVSITSDGVTETVPLTAIVAESEDDASWDGLKRTLEIGLIILVIILILIGLIVGFNKLRGSDDDDDDAKTYY